MGGESCLQFVKRQQQQHLWSAVKWSMPVLNKTLFTKTGGRPDLACADIWYIKLNTIENTILKYLRNKYFSYKLNI